MTSLIDNTFPTPRSTSYQTAQKHKRHSTDVWNIRQSLLDVSLPHPSDACLSCRTTNVIAPLSNISTDVRHCTTIARTQTDLCPCLSIIHGSSYTISCFCHCRLGVVHKKGQEDPSVAPSLNPSDTFSFSSFSSYTRVTREKAYPFTIFL